MLLEEIKQVFSCATTDRGVRCKEAYELHEIGIPYDGITEIN